MNLNTEQILNSPANKPQSRTSIVRAPHFPQLRVAYIMSRFPKLTETFVLYEMIAMEQHGDFEIVVYPLLREKTLTEHPEAAEWVRRAHYMPLISWPILKAQFFYLRRHPWNYLRLWWEVLRGTWGSLNFFLGAFAILPKSVWFAREMDLSKVQHVHAHFANHPAVAGLAVHRLAGIPFSFTAHGADFHKDHHMLAEKVEAAAFVVTVSQYNKEMIVRICGESIRDKVHIVHCGVDTEIFKPIARKTNKGVFDILCVGTLEEVKGQAYLIEACRRLMQNNINFMCHLVGEGRDRGKLERQIREAGLTERVFLHGGKPRPEVAKMLSDADVFVLASVPTRSGKREGIPVALMEAMASGLPVVSSAISGIPELVENGRAGLLIPYRDSEALENSLQSLHYDPEMRLKLGREARKKVLREFDLSANIAKLAQLLNNGVTK